MSDIYFPNTEIKKNITITEVGNTDYKEYALYTIYNRAIPALSDGFKTVQRKTFWTATKKLTGDNFIKAAALSGYVMAESHYAHGDSSLNEAIVVMTQDFKQSLPYFLPDGDFGSIYAPTAGAARYVSLYLSPLIEHIFKDNNLLEYQYAEGDKVEPVTYFPIIPTVLINGTNGIAVGYANSIANKNPLILIDAIIEYLKTGVIDEHIKLQPYIKGAVGHWIRFFDKFGNDRYEHHGFMHIKNSTTVEITGLAANFTFESYETYLNKLVTDGFCSEWLNESDKHTPIKYVIKFNKQQLEEHIKKDVLYHKLKMYYRIPKDCITVIDIDGKVKTFTSQSELIQRFVNWRYDIYTTRKQVRLKELLDKIKFNVDKIRFINLVNDGTIKIKEFKSRQEAKNALDAYELPLELVDIKLYSISADEIAKLLDKNKQYQEEYDKLALTSETDLYIKDLEDLRNACVNDGLTIEPCDEIFEELLTEQ